MWRTIPCVLLISNCCLTQLFSFLPYQISTFAPSLLENDGQVISVGLESGLPYDIASVLENSMGHTLTVVSLVGGELCPFFLPFWCIFWILLSYTNKLHLSTHRTKVGPCFSYTFFLLVQWALCFWSALYFKWKCLSSSIIKGVWFNEVLSSSSTPGPGVLRKASTRCWAWSLACESWEWKKFRARKNW